MNERLAVHERRARSWSWRIATTIAAAAALLLPAAGVAGATAANGKEIVAYVPPTLLKSAQATPKESFDVHGISDDQVKEIHDSGALDPPQKVAAE